MLIVTVNQTKYNILGWNSNEDGIYQDWSEITLDKAIALKKIIDTKAPSNLLEHYQDIADNKEDKELELHDKDRIKVFPAFYGECLSILSDIPQQTIDKIKWSERTAIYIKYIQHYVFHLIYTDYAVKPYENDNFTFDGTTYYLPKEKEALGTMIPAYDTSMTEFAQSSDVLLAMKDLEGGNIEALKTLIAIYCRPKGEKYDEVKALDRSIVFGDLDMSIALGVFFCIYELIIRYMNRTLTSLAEAEALKQGKHSKSQDWKRLGGMLQSLKS